jgi:hypothetical protein
MNDGGVVAQKVDFIEFPLRDCRFEWAGLLTMLSTHPSFGEECLASVTKVVSHRQQISVADPGDKEAAGCRH